LARPYCPLGAADRLLVSSVGLGIEELGAGSGCGFGALVAWCVGLWVAPARAAVVVVVVVGALLQSLSGRRRWHNRRFAFRLGRDGQHRCADENERTCLLFRHCEGCVMMSELVWKRYEYMQVGS
jgi:hypothetical protein